MALFLPAIIYFGATMSSILTTTLTTTLAIFSVSLDTVPIFVATNFFTAIPIWLTIIPALIYNLATGKTFLKQEYLYLYATGTASYFIKLKLGESYGWLISLTTFAMAPIMWLFSILTSLLFVLPGILFIFIELIVCYFVYNGLLQIPLLSTPIILLIFNYR